MKKIIGLFFCLVLGLLAVAIYLPGCRAEERDTEVFQAEEQEVLKGRGVLVGQIDAGSVEIETEGRPRAFALGPEVSVAGIADGSKILFTYVEEDNRPVLLSVTVEESPVFEQEGILTGLIDSHSVEIEIDNGYVAFSLAEGVTLTGIPDGSRVKIAYREGEHRPILLFIEMIEGPENGEAENGDSSLLEVEGILVGQVDSQSVEIEMRRAFALAPGVSVDNITDGSLVAFTYSENGARPVIDYIEAVGEPREGELAHGTYVGQIDSQSIEIHYFQVFALDEATSLEGIDDGDEIAFTYRKGQFRPVLTAIKLR